MKEDNNNEFLLEKGNVAANSHWKKLYRRYLQPLLNRLLLYICISVLRKKTVLLMLKEILLHNLQRYVRFSFLCKLQIVWGVVNDNLWIRVIFYKNASNLALKPSLKAAAFPELLVFPVVEGSLEWGWGGRWESKVVALEQLYWNSVLFAYTDVKVHTIQYIILYIVYFKICKFTHVAKANCVRRRNNASS